MSEDQAEVPAWEELALPLPPHLPAEVRDNVEQATTTIGIRAEIVRGHERAIDELADGFPSHWEIVPDNGRCFAATGDVFAKSLTDLEDFTTLQLQATQTRFVHDSGVLHSVLDTFTRVNEGSAESLAAWQAAVDAVGQTSQAGHDERTAARPAPGAGTPGAGQEDTPGTNPWGSGDK